MYNQKIDELEKILGEIYSGYLDEGTRKESILQLGKLFNIDIHEERIKDYDIVSIDIDNLCIEISDKRYGVVFKSSYTSCCDLLDYYGCRVRFIVVEEIDDDKYLKKVYHIDEDNPIITKMSFIQDGYALEFEKEVSNSEDTFLDNGEKLTIRYLRYNDGVFEPLITKIEKRNITPNGVDSYEREYTYDKGNVVTNGDSYDKSMYLINNNIVYVIDDLSVKTPVSYIKGVCFESTGVDMQRYMPSGMDVSNYDLLDDEDTVSAIIFKGIIEDNIHVLEIYKNSENINVRYRIQNNAIDESEVQTVHSENIELQRVDIGSISLGELDQIKQVLNAKDEFIHMVLNELSSFSKKMYIKNGYIEEVYNPLSPKTLFNKDFDLIAKSVCNYKKDYFDFIDNHFKSITHPNSKIK